MADAIEPAPPAESLIEIEGLTKRFGTFTAVDNVSLHRRPRRGAGLPRPQRRRQIHHHAHAGRLHDSRPPAPPGSAATTCRPTRVAARRMLGFLPEGAPTYPEMTVAGFLRFCAGIRGYQRRRAGRPGRSRDRPDHAGGRPAAAGGDPVQRLQAPRRPGAGAAARSAGAGAGRTDRRPRSQPEARGARADRAAWRRRRRSSSPPISWRRSMRSAPAPSSSPPAAWWPTRRPPNSSAAHPSGKLDDVFRDLTNPPSPQDAPEHAQHR